MQAGRRRVGQVVFPVDRGDDVLVVLRDDDVGEDEGAARLEDRGDAPEEVLLAGAVEVMDGERGDDEVERGPPAADPAAARGAGRPAGTTVRARSSISALESIATRRASGWAARTRFAVSPVPMPSSRIVWAGTSAAALAACSWSSG
jgi:hypothetical protein